MSEVAVRAVDVSRVFTTGAGDVHALRGVSLEAHPGELVVVRGPSGSGKTTLLNLLGGLDRPTSGRVLLGDGRELSALAERDVLEARRTQIGYVFQSFGLIPVLSAAENVEVPLRLLEVEPRERDERVAAALETVGLSGHARQRPYELSGGQQQRVGIARALVARPQILIADEPTGQLDSGTAATIMTLIRALTHSQGLAAVVSTHDPVLMQQADRVVELHDGALASADEGRPAG
ncbi:ABC transporter ATP-binding protein [Georgenia sp. MJ206]|uniref:ABC transporter ATP-binding protein n=1 Tax=Georgenia wangjunii TaxID=3117730 RepID=UPI002F269679